MKIGFVGAGKVGFSLGRYFVDHQLNVMGYYSRNPKNAEEAAQFTNTKHYQSLDKLTQDSEVLFITVSDGAISQVWEELKELEIKDRIICHCSGVLSSEVFSGKAEHNCSGYSIHPLLAVSSKYESYKEFSNALFTIEGDEEHFSEMFDLMKNLGNKVLRISADEKIRYHGAAVLASNLVLGLVETAVQELMRCGFEREDAFNALVPLTVGNVLHLQNDSIEESLTGPAERGDDVTILKHLEKFDGDDREIYRLISKKAVEIAKRKNPDRDYTKVEDLVNE